MEEVLANSQDSRDDFVFIQQFVDSVTAFSSQYGGGDSILYSVSNITGKPTNFPGYGDFPESFALRTYGPWWDQAPSATKPFMVQSLKKITSKDFVELTFERLVIPSAVVVYETFNAGSVVRIWALEEVIPVENDSGNTWHLLWEGEPAEPTIGESEASKFSPKLNTINVAIRTLRIEFDHSRSDYFPGIDAVMLLGLASTGKPLSPVQSGILTSDIHHIPDSVDVEDTFMSFLLDQKGYLKYLAEWQERFLPTQPAPARCGFSDLPDEIVLKILGYCDLKSLCRLAQVSRSFHSLTLDPLLYTELNFKDYWWCTSKALVWARPRLKYLHKLDLSWARYKNPLLIREFLRDHCANLTHLRMNASMFACWPTLQYVLQYCPLLRELSLQTNSQLRVSSARPSLRHLQRLDLYHSSVSFDCLLVMLRENPGLRHLNLGSCDFLHPDQYSQVEFLNQLAEVMATHNRQLVSLDLWKAGQIGMAGLQSLATLADLEEIDLGWCAQILEPSNKFEVLAQGCRKLRKLFLGACRVLTERDIQAFIQYLPLLEQVDLMGNIIVTPEVCLQMLHKCKHLKYLDVSFCYLITTQVPVWRRLFPGVSIKQSSGRSADYLVHM